MEASSELENLKTLLERYDAGHADLTGLVGLERKALLESETPGQQLAIKLREADEYLFAYDVVRHSIEGMCRDESCFSPLPNREQANDIAWLFKHIQPGVCEDNLLVLKQMKGNLLKDMGAPGKGAKVFDGLYQVGFRDDETLGNLAACLKAWAIMLSQDDPKKQQLLRRAYEVYQEALNPKDRVNRLWMGVNIATLGLMLDEAVSEQAQALIELCNECLEENDKDYWAWVGRAELLMGQALLAGDRQALQAVADDYAEAARHHTGYFQLRISRKNPLLLAQWAQSRDDKKWEGLCDEVRRWLPIPAVLAFVGHIVDATERPQARFPQSQCARLQQTLSEYIKEHDIGWSYAAAAAGADILMAEAMHEADRRINVILPFDEEAFCKTSVALRDDVVEVGQSLWSERFWSVLNIAREQKRESIWRASTHRMPDNSIHFAYSNDVIHGLARLQAERLDTEVRYLAVWDGETGDGFGGTADAVAAWSHNGRDVQVIDPKAAETIYTIPSGTAPKPVLPWNKRLDELSRGDMALKAMVFTDVQGYSCFDEPQIKAYYEQLLTLAADLLKPHKSHVEFSNTWGDAMFMVFDDLGRAGDFALSLCEKVAQLNREKHWERFELPNPLHVRVALHAGPVQCLYDPVLDKELYSGAQVSHAARIEPVTPPGEVYASVGAAALAAAWNITSFRCDYVGKVPLAKDYGVQPLFHVRRRLVS